MGIPRANRLRHNNDFRRVRASGRSWANHWLVTSVLPNDLGRVRVGVSASRRVGGAVQRVRAKRLIREAMRPRLPQVVGGWDVIFIARTPLASAQFRQVDQAVGQLLHRAGLLAETRV